MDHTSSSARRKTRKRITTPDWLVTYGDMITLLLAFFIALFTTATIDGYEIRLILSAFRGFGDSSGGNSLEATSVAELGNSVLSLPSAISGRKLSRDRSQVDSVLQSIQNTSNIITREDERGIVVSLGADTFFASGSAEVDIESARDTLLELASLLQQPELDNTLFRIEGHTDSIPPDPNGAWPTNWDLSTARAINILRYLIDYGVNDRQLQVMGLADTSPVADENTAEGRALNRRVDIILLTGGL